MRWTSFALVAMLVSACGVHVRGDASLSARMQAPYLAGQDRYTPFHAELQRFLQAAGAEPAASAEAATAVVRIWTDETGRNILSISARNTPQEYEVYYRVEYSVTAGGEEILPRQQLMLTREYAYDETAVLAKEHEERDIVQALARDLAALVTRRLAAL